MLTEEEKIGRVVKKAKKIESLLVRKGANGKGMIEKAKSIRKQLGEPLFEDIKKIGRIRNKAVHEDGFRIEDFPQFEKDCKQVLSKLKGYRNYLWFSIFIIGVIIYIAW